MKSLLMLISTADITTYVNIGFFVIAGLIVLGGIFGIRKGIIKSSYRIIWNSIMILLGVLLTKFIGEKVAEIDISSLVSSININGTEITVTTVFETLKRVILAFGGEDSATIQYMLVNDPDTVVLVESLAHMIINYVVFIVWMILVITVFALLGFLMWHIAFKHIFKKETRKKAKGRKKLLCIGVNLVNAIVVACMFFTPFTALINTVGSATQDTRDSTKPLSNEAYNNILDYIEAYNNSAMAQTFFFTGSNGSSIDTKIMNYITSSTYNGEELYFLDEVNTIVGTGIDLLQSGLFAEDGTMNTTALLEKDVMAGLIDSLSDSNLITNILAIAGNVAINYADTLDILDAEKIDSDTIKKLSWKSELQYVKKIFNALYDAGIVTELKDGISSFTIPVDNTDGAVTAMKEAFNHIGESSLLSLVIPSVIYNFATKTDAENNPTTVAKLLTSNWDDYKNINWGNELNALYDFVVNLAAEGIDVNEIVGLGGSSESTDTPTGEEPTTAYRTHYFEGETTTETEEKSLLDKVLENLDNIIPLITGYSGYVENTENLVSSTKSCLFDSKILSSSINKMLTYAIDTYLPSETTPEESTPASESSQFVMYEGEETSSSSLSSNILSAINKDKIKDVIANDLKTVNDYKAELFHLLEGAKSLIVDAKVLEGVDYSSDNFKNGLTAAAPEMDRSKILKSVLPDVLEVVTADLPLDSVGITASDLNFKDVTYAIEIPKMVGVLGDIMTISDQISSGNIATMMDKDNGITDKLENVLTVIYESKIFNPTKTDEEGHTTKDYNFKAIMNTIFDMPQFDTMGIYPDIVDGENITKVGPDLDSITHWTDYKDESGNTIKGEIGAICSVFTQISEQDIISILTTDGDVKITSFKGKSLSNLFAAVGSSKLISATFGKVLDSKLSDFLGDGNGISFMNVTDWASEGKIYDTIIGQFGETQTSIESIDFLNEDTTKTKTILNAFASSQIFDVTTTNTTHEQAFGNFVYSTLTKLESIKVYLNDINLNDGTAVDSTKMAEDDFSNVQLWVDEGTSGSAGYTEGEISKIIKVIDKLQALGGKTETSTVTNYGTLGLTKLTSGTDLTSETLTGVINVIGDSEAFKMITVNAIKSVISSMSLDGLSFDTMNLPSLIDLSQESGNNEFKTELLKLPGILDYVNKFKSATKITDYQTSDIKGLLSILNGSCMFNTVLPSNKGLALSNNNCLSTYETVVKFIISKAKLNSYLHSYEGTYSDEYINGRIRDVTTNNGWNDTSKEINNETVITNGEVSKLCNLVSNIQNNTTESGKISFDFNTMTTANLSSLMSSVNKSYLLHDALPNLLNEKVGAYLTGDLACTPHYYLDDEYNLDDEYATFESLVTAYETEISYICELFPFIKNMSQFDNIKEINTDNFKNMLNSLNESKIFNTLDGHGDDSSSSSTSRTTLTAFETFVKNMVKKLPIKDYIHSSNTSTFSESEMNSKLISMSENDLWNDSEKVVDDKNVTIDGEITKLGNLINTIKTVFAEKEVDLDFNKLSATEIDTLLTPINHSQLLHNSVPNIIKEGFNLFATGDLACSPNFYMENYIGEESFEVQASAFDNEIDNMCNALPYLKDLSSLTDLTKLNVTNVNSLLSELESSTMFNTFADNVVNDWEGRTDLTAFETIIKLIINNSGLSSKYPTGTNLNTLIINVGNTFDTQTTISKGWTGNNGELRRINTLLTRIKAFGTVTGETLTSASKDDFNGLLTSINECQLTHPVMPNIFKDAIVQSGLSILCTSTPNYDLSTETNPISAYNNEIAEFASLIDSMKYKDDSNNTVMFSLSGDKAAFTSFISSTHSTSQLLHTLQSSKILGNCGGEIMYSILDGVGMSNYIFGSSNSEKIATIQSLFTNTNASFTIISGISNEGAALDQLILKLTNDVESMDLSSINNATTINSIIMLCQDEDDNNRAYFASELVSGFMQDLLGGISTTMDNYSWRGVDDLTTEELNEEGSYPLLSVHTRDGFNQIFKIKNAYSDYDTNGNTDSTKKTDFITTMVEFDNFNKTGNSLVGLQDSMLNALFEELFYNSVSINEVRVGEIAKQNNAETRTAQADNITNTHNMVYGY